MKKKILALTLALCASLSAAAIPVSAEVETKSAAIANIDMSWPYIKADNKAATKAINSCLLYTSPSPRDGATSRMPSSA